MLLLVPVYDALTGYVVAENRDHNKCVRDVSWHPYMPDMISSSVRESIVEGTSAKIISDFVNHMNTSNNYRLHLIPY